MKFVLLCFLLLTFCFQPFLRPQDTWNTDSILQGMNSSAPSLKLDKLKESTFSQAIFQPLISVRLDLKLFSAEHLCSQW